MTGELARPATCEVRSAQDTHGTPVRASAGAGVRRASESTRFAATIGVGFDALRVERACRPGSGWFPSKPHLSVALGPWLDGSFVAGDAFSVRPAVFAAFGRHETGFLAMPELEVFGSVGASWSSRWRSSISLGVRLIVLQLETRLDLAPNDSQAFVLLGVHADLNAL